VGEERVKSFGNIDLVISSRFQKNKGLLKHTRGMEICAVSGAEFGIRAIKIDTLFIGQHGRMSEAVRETPAPLFPDSFTVVAPSNFRLMVTIVLSNCGPQTCLAAAIAFDL
jgi:hypothetical protein